jgi:glucokinase
MTNRDFKINAEALKSEFGFKSCYLLNDWESIGFSLAGTSSQDIQFLQTGEPFNKTAFMIGPGTGLGAAFISESLVFPTEVGNTKFTFHKILTDNGVRNVDGFNVLEDLLSGRGISRLYENFSGVLNSPEDVVRLCKDKDQNAIKAIDTFIDSLAIAISDMALTYMPGRGIFVAGGLMRTIYNFIDNERFINSFIGQRKSMHQELLQKMPIGIITREMTCLHGNLAFLTSQLMKS